MFDFLQLFSLLVLLMINNGRSNPLKLSQTDETWTNGWGLIESIKVSKLLYVYGIEYAISSSMSSLSKLYLNWSWFIVFPVP